MVCKNECKNMDKLIQKLKCIRFDDKKVKDTFLDFMHNNVKDCWDPFRDVVWKDIIYYSIHFPKNKDLKLGKWFKESQNGIYDFITSGFSFGRLEFYETYSYIFNSNHGIMLLKIHDEQLFCYYKINMGGCHTCDYDTGTSMGFDKGYPVHVSLYISTSMDDLVKYCMTKYERKLILKSML